MSISLSCATTTESHTSYFVNDGRGSVAQTTNAQGATTSWKSYSAFGEIEASSTLGELPTYGYNAEEQHPKTGLTYLRFRYYEASTSTFGVQDTYLGNIFSPLTLNRYLYCLSNPVNYVDPTGHVSVGSLLTGGIVGTITTAIANIKVTILEVIRPHADKIFGKGSRAKIDRDIALAKAARDRIIKFYCGQAERIAASKKSQAGFYANLERFANDYWYAPIASDIAEVGVSSNNGDIPKTIFNLGMLVAGVTPAKAIHGTSKLSPIIAKLFKGTDKAEDAAKAADKAQDIVSGIKRAESVQQNRLHHIFDNPKHKMDDFVAKYNGDKEKAYRALENGVLEYIAKTKKESAKDWTRITVDGEEVDATWVVINGKLIVSDGSKRDIL